MLSLCTTESPNDVPFESTDFHQLNISSVQTKILFKEEKEKKKKNENKAVFRKIFKKEKEKKVACQELVWKALTWFWELSSMLFINCY